MTKTYTTQQAAQYLGVSPGRVRQLISDGVIEAGFFGRERVITKDALDGAKKRKTKPGPATKTKAVKRVAQQKG